MRYVITRKETSGGQAYTRYICPHCGNTIMISDNTTPINLPEFCGRCGRDIYHKEEADE